MADVSEPSCSSKDGHDWQRDECPNMTRHATLEDYV